MCEGSVNQRASTGGLFIRFKKYAVVKKINQYISQIVGPVIMNSTRTGTFHNSTKSENETINASSILTANFLTIDNPDILVGAFKSKTSPTRYLLLVSKKNDTLPVVNMSLKGNFTQSLKLYPRMNELKGSIDPKSVQAKLSSGRTSFTINNFLPGEAILFSY